MTVRGRNNFMGFYVSKDNNQIRLRISYQSHEIISQDIAEFQNMPEKEQLSSFLNKIINNFCNEAESTVYAKKQKIYDKYLKWLKGLENAEKTAEQLTEKEIRNRFEKIEEKYSQPPRAKGQNLKLIMTKPTIEMLENSQEKDLYEDKISDYLAALIQEYTALSREERERIFFKDLFKTINLCIKHGHQAEINGSYLLKPYKITTNGFLPYYYVVGYARRKNKLTAPWKLMSFRLQRIRSATEKEDDEYKFTKEQETELKELFKKPAKIAYLSKKEEETIVKLTEKGYNDCYKKILSGRPVCTDKKKLPDSEKPFVYELAFNCSNMQAYQYFIRFGMEVEVISPEHLRNGFKNLHENAVKYYK